ncbi:MAG: hypothetical protein FJZ80_01840 [Bacteroidetes bacterium]|nr:hypothetical protein [Bacteroidota bacterium]
MSDPLHQEAIASIFYRWIQLMHPDRMKFNPKFIASDKEKVVFGMTKHMGRFVVSITTMHHDLAQNQPKKLNRS